ncbi:MAG: hypothetical protein LBB39_01495 [Mycoplasmataceae bacterium]|nr:hypothetical protein [Mycoplasmataceae bacterium]
MNLEEKRSLYLTPEILNKVASRIDFFDYHDFEDSLKNEGEIMTVNGKKLIFKITKTVKHKFYGEIPFYNFTMPIKFSPNPTNQEILAWSYCVKILKVKPICPMQAYELIVNNLNNIREVLFVPPPKPKAPIIIKKPNVIVEKIKKIKLEKSKKQAKELSKTLKKYKKQNHQLIIENEELIKFNQSLVKKNSENMKIIDEYEKKIQHLEFERLKLENSSKPDKKLVKKEES